MKSIKAPNTTSSSRVDLELLLAVAVQVYDRIQNVAAVSSREVAGEGPFSNFRSVVVAPIPDDCLK